MLSLGLHKVTTGFETSNKFTGFSDVICEGNPCLSFPLRSLISTGIDLGSREAWIKFRLLPFYVELLVLK